MLWTGAMPVWLSPFQVAVASITDDQIEYAKEVVAKIKQAGIRVAQDLRGEKINYKIRELVFARSSPTLLLLGTRKSTTVR